MKNNIILSTVLTVLILSACQGKKDAQNLVEPAPNKGIELTKQQFETANMAMGEAMDHTFFEVINSKGYLEPILDGEAQVTVGISGKVKEILHKNGEWVQKGEALLKLQGNEIIQLQMEYVQSQSKLALAKAEMDRVKSLVDAKVAATKDYQMALSEYQVLYATKDALSAKLNLLMLDPKHIEAGKIVSEVSVVAPISGYITSVNVRIGEYLNEQVKAMEIVNNKKLRLSFFVFENAVADLKVDQKIQFFEPDRKNQIYTASIEMIGKTIDQDTKTIPCGATIDNIKNLNLVNGMYAECNIIVNEHIGKAIPTEAVVKEGSNHFVLVKSGESADGYIFSKVKVEIGYQDIEFTEIVNADLTNILLKGLYNLNFEE
ncbi:MAG: efflux RND transporter periplasmic adaptor subunit [Prolixibacteraceae bacterium]